jgi:hypothetical protein
MRLWFRVLVTLLAFLAATVTPTPAQAQTNSFIDDDNSRFEPFIETAKAEGLVSGCNPPDNSRICPQQPMTRGDVAIMLARAISAPAPTTDHFVDDQGHPAETAANALMDAGVGTSCRGNNFCPDRPITRGELALTIAKTFRWTEPADPGRYVDLADSKFQMPLAQLAERGGLLACDAPVNSRLCPTAIVRRDEAVFALVTAMGLQPSGSRTKDPQLEPLGFGDGFYDLTLWDGRTPSPRNRVAITPSGYEGSGLRVGIPKGSHYGADFHLHLDDAASTVPERLFFRYYLRFDSNWSTPTAGKLPGFSGVYGSTGKGGAQSSPSQPGWSARLMFSPTKRDGRVYLGYYVYHLGQETRYGDGFGWNESGKLRPGEWYCLEGEVEMNTPGLADGALRAWVDGTPALDLSGLAFRRPSEPQIKIESFWFNVYYGGKPVAPRSLGLTVDEVMVDTQRVGCGLSTPAPVARADFDGNGFRDTVTWGDCPGGSCFITRKSTWSGDKVVRQNGDGAWFSIETARYGMAAGDVDGDGRNDIVYRGRCEGAIRCWRVHESDSGLRRGSNWGDRARFADGTDFLTLGDWNGDGLDDLTYEGLCGEAARACWRVHPSTGTGFGEPQEWGSPPEGMAAVTAVDVDGDGADDLLYRAPCDESDCWFVQHPDKGRFSSPVALGRALEPGPADVEWTDFDGDGIRDLVSWVNTDTGAWIEVRYTRDGALEDPIPLTRLGSPIEGISIRRLEERETVQTVVKLRCKDGSICVRTLMAPTPYLLVNAERFLEERWKLPGYPEIS